MKTKTMVLGSFFLFLSSTQTFALTLEEQTDVMESYATEHSGEISKSIEKMVSILQKNPDHYMVNLRLGWLFYLNKTYKNSIDHYEHAAQVDPASIEPLLGLSLVYLTTGVFEKAAHTCGKVLQRDPKNYTATQRLITAQIRLGQYKEALGYATSAIRLYPTDPVFLEQYAFLLKENGKTEESKASLATLLLVSPQNVYARSQLAKPAGK